MSRDQASLVRRPQVAGRLVLSVIVLMFAAPPVRADQDVQAWTLERVGREALARSPQVRSARATLEAARAYRAFGSMSRVGNPILGLRAMVGRPDQSAATYSAYLGLPFDFSGKRPAYRREATWVEREAEEQLLTIQNEARSEARAAYVSVVLSAEQERVATANSEVARDFLSRVKARFDARAATALDVALSQRDYAESAAAVAEARISLASARGRLRQVLDLDPEAQVDTQGLPPLSLPQGLTLQRAITLAYERRRDPAVYRASASRAQAADKRLRREAVAPVIVAGEMEAQANVDTKYTGGVGVNTELPILLKNQGDRAVVRAEGSVAELNAELNKRTVGREAVTAYRQLEAALAELAAIEQDAMPAAEQALAMTTEMLEVGAIDYFRLLSARENAFALRAKRVEVLRVAWLLRIELERSVGGLQEGP